MNTILSPIDRVIVSAPKNCWNVFYQVFSNGDVKCSGQNFDGEKVMFAKRVSENVFQVVIENYNHCMGKLQKGKVIEFQTDLNWIQEWISTVSPEIVYSV